MKKLWSLCLLVFLLSCHPLALFNGAQIRSPELTLLKEGQDIENVEIARDAFGIPFIKAKSIPAAFYSLGFMHAHDRLFQLDLIRHAALGRLSELFGRRVLSYDRTLRILSYRLDEQLSHLSAREHGLLDAYVAGVNEGARQRKKSAEHFLLGISFGEFTKRDVVAIARLQAWQLGMDIVAEVARLKIAKSHIPKAAKQEMCLAVDDKKSAIIKSESTLNNSALWLWPTYLKDAKAQPIVAPKKREDIVQVNGGASNAWAIAGHLAEDKHAILMNDPHLRHTWPSNFYIASIETDDFKATGASFVGLPAILIGAGPALSWGITASYLNTQDAVYLKLDKTKKNNYIVDEQSLSLSEWPQKFCLDKKNKNNCIDEMHYTSVFGPVADRRFDAFIDEEDRLAVQWTGFLVEKHDYLISPFINLAQAKNVEEGILAISSMSLPGVNIVIADSLGDIAYAYAGLVPKRDLSQNPYLPLDGSRLSSRWDGVLSREQEPKLSKPKDGYLVTANQNIYSNDVELERAFGTQGAHPYRALQIKQGIRELLSKNKAISMKELSYIQLDSRSFEAKDLSTKLGLMCQEAFHHQGSRSEKRFAKELVDFNGDFNSKSLGALPYAMILDDIVGERLNSMLGEEFSPEGRRINQINFAVLSALEKELAGEKTAVFSYQAPQNFKEYINSRCKSAYEKTIKKAGTAAWKWRWGRHHYVYRQGALGSAPLVGSFFSDKRREVSGYATSPLAETGMPVQYGASMRFWAKMSSPPQVFIVSDAGNSGDLGSAHSLDQGLLWHKGENRQISTDWQEAKAQAKSTFTIKYSEP